jgi:hypothetical protein
MKIKLLKSLIIFICAFFHIALIYTFPPSGGGVALFFTLTIPFIFILSLFLSLVYYFKISESSNRLFRNFLFYGSVILLISLGYIFFPCNNSGKIEIPERPCPCEYLGKMNEIISNKNEIKYEDIFKDDYYSTLIKTSALKKYKNNLPETYYTISFSNREQEYVIYFKKGKVFSNNKKLKILRQKNQITYFEKYKNDTLIFKSNLYNFRITDDNYNSQNNDGNFEKKNNDYTIYINKGTLNRNKEFLIYNIIYRMI